MGSGESTIIISYVFPWAIFSLTNIAPSAMVRLTRGSSNEPLGIEGIYCFMTFMMVASISTTSISFSEGYFTASRNVPPSQPMRRAVFGGIK